jgi:RasGAP C-terminus
MELTSLLTVWKTFNREISHIFISLVSRASPDWNGRLPYTTVKEHALIYLLELEKLGKVTRADGYQGVLNAIAGDVRSKHRKRIQRKNEMESMNDALKHLKERKKAYEEQIQSYHSYIDSAMNTMQRSKGCVLRDDCFYLAFDQ